jgi:hypothetical protein
MSRSTRFIVCAALAGAAAFAPAEAWTDGTRARMLKDALKVAPPALTAILAKHARDLERGMKEPSRRESEEVHFQGADGRSGLAATAVARKEAEARDLLGRKGSLKRFVYEMGVLAHLTADVSFPLNPSEADAREPLYREAYRAYIERMLEKIPYVFDPAPAPALDAGDFETYLVESARRAGRDYAAIGAAFKDDGTPKSAAAVDERSVPFGAASLAYSQAVNDIVRVWERLWRDAGGDPAGAPHPEEAPAPPPATASAGSGP